MLDLYELQQLVTFAELGTLSSVAEKFHISTPSVTRSMQHLEQVFGVTLFARGKNRIELTKTGELAVEQAWKVLQEADRAVQLVRSFEQRQHTIVIKSCAPAPLWELLRELNAQHPNMMVSSAVCQNDEIVEAWENDVCDIAVLPFPLQEAKQYMCEKLCVCVPSDHELAKHKSLTFGEINGFNFLLRTELGFWDTLCREKMPASKFLVQTDPAEFDELVRASSLPCFTTDYSQSQFGYPNRVNVPLSDSEANVTFYILRKHK